MCKPSFSDYTLQLNDGTAVLTVSELEGYSVATSPNSPQGSCGNVYIEGFMLGKILHISRA